MTLFLCLLFVTWSGNTQAQETEAKTAKTCEYRTDGKPGAHGMRLSLWVPCSWTKLDAANASILANYSESFADSSSLTHLMMLDKLARPIPPEQLESLFTTDGMKMIARQAGKYVSASKVRLNEWDAAEVRYWTQYKQGAVMIYSYGVQYYIPMTDKILSLTFSLSAADKEQAKAAFAKKESEFRTVARSLLVR